MITELLLVHHSHTDVGYTHPQPVALELHLRYMDEALDLIDLHRGNLDSERFRWTCESAAVALAWFRSASGRDRERFLAAASDGLLEVAALAWNYTPLLDSEGLLHALAPARELRALGVAARHAMQTDVNGVPWGAVDVLLDHGVAGLTMSINEHFGHAPQPRPLAFRWQSPSGRELLAFNGLKYGSDADYILKISGDIAATRRALPAYLARWEERDYPHPFLMLQVTNHGMHDNASSNPELPAFVHEWNASGHPVRLRLSSLSELFARIEATPPETVPAWRGDWTDWWNFGSGSTARATGLALAGARHLAEARALAAWPGLRTGLRRAALERRAQDDLDAFVEHTWSAERTNSHPDSVETRVQNAWKEASAAEGYALARMLARDGLGALAGAAGGSGERLLAFNPHPFPVSASLRVPLRWPEDEARQQDSFQHRQDPLFSDLADDEARWTGPLSLPPLGYASLAFADLPQAGGGLRAEGLAAANGRVSLELDPERGGLRSLLLDGRERVSAGEWAFAQPVLERPAGGKRSDIYGPGDWTQPEMHHLWHTGWQAERAGGRVLAGGTRLLDGAASAWQEIGMANGDRVRLEFLLLPGEGQVRLTARVAKAGDRSPHGLYLAFPLALAGKPVCHYATAGAVVELDREQLPYASRHYLTTLDWLRLQGDDAGFTVATPDAPLWQVGGFTFGHHHDGRVDRPEPFLAAWLTNNYWDTNFPVDQSGLVSFRLGLIPHERQELARSIGAAMTLARPPLLHFHQAGSERQGPPEGRLLDVRANGAVLSGIERAEGGVLLRFLNPSDGPLSVELRPAALRPSAWRRANLAGEPGDPLAQVGEAALLALLPREWAAVLATTGS